MNAGRPPKPPEARLSEWVKVRVTPPMMDRLYSEARRRRLTGREFVRQAITYFCESPVADQK